MELAPVYKWSDRDSPVDPELSLIITAGTNVFGMGSCFADNVVRYLVTQMGLQAASFEESRFYDPVSDAAAARRGDAGLGAPGPECRADE